MYARLLLKMITAITDTICQKGHKSCHQAKIHPRAHLWAPSLKFALLFLKNDGMFLSCLHPSNLIFRTVASCCCT